MNILPTVRNHTHSVNSSNIPKLDVHEKGSKMAQKKRKNQQEFDEICKVI